VCVLPMGRIAWHGMRISACRNAARNKGCRQQQAAGMLARKGGV
jgi:hypothetical protein